MIFIYNISNPIMISFEKGLLQLMCAFVLTCNPYLLSYVFAPSL